jgi:outer membrane lipoprotein-sorting protein
MQARPWTRVSALIATGVLFQGTAAVAQTAKAPPTPEWNQTVTKESGVAGGREFDAKQMDVIQKVTAYFNQMGDMKGLFVQTSADGKKLRGKIYVKRPAFRFEYNLPSRQLIISDGQQIAIQDHDLKTDDRQNIDKTAFRIILRKDVDLLRDARVLDAGEVDNKLFVTIQDKDPNTPGRLKLFLSKRATEFKEWISTDSQNLDTHVELTEFTKAEDLDPKLFQPPAIMLEKLRQ